MVLIFPICLLHRGDLVFDLQRRIAATEGIRDGLFVSSSGTAQHCNSMLNRVLTKEFLYRLLEAVWPLANAHIPTVAIIARRFGPGRAYASKVQPDL